MKQCNDMHERLALYLDHELQGDERTDFEAHLGQCQSCRSLVDSEQSFLDAIRRSRPLYEAAPELRQRVEKLVTSTDNNSAAGVHLLPPVRRGLDDLVFRGSTVRGRWLMAVAAGLLVLLLPIVVWRVARQRSSPYARGPSSFALMAADTHLRQTRGQLPLEIVSDQPQEISDWFANKVSFSVKLPNYQEVSGQEKLYKLDGARLVSFKDDYAAYVAYRMRNRSISLVITSDNLAIPSGGEEIKAKGLTFHYDTIRGLKVLTWSDRGLTYALVSDLEERGQQSCVVCHQGTKDQDFIAPLKPK